MNVRKIEIEVGAITKPKIEQYKLSVRLRRSEWELLKAAADKIDTGPYAFARKALVAVAEQVLNGQSGDG